ncbi:lytic murein transglycosylase [Sphingomonas alba]|uniref:Lytic murein transglycosylase n=1 Tax=Sphingomonas alba TaxID=2908208 RepID=A0ABT0RIX3_9SPHN|nr:lytic murein transglycosylase [Sphingomonas alba]MCL6682562.1 lytic murein transglycosylase [Sphingomonas alba]
MKRVGTLLLRGVLAVVGSSIGMTASAQLDPLAPLPESRSPPTQQLVPVVPVATSLAPQVSTGFEAYRQRLTYIARSGGISEATIAAIVPYLQLNNRVIRLDRGQPGAVGNTSYTPPFAPYRREHVTSDLINRGQSRYRDLWPWLSRVEQRTGVPASVMMAIYGHETSYGSVTGGFDIIEALASLAYEGRRRPLFESEFVAGLKLIDMGIPRWRLKGSYAGATGYPQFMPSTVIRLRADGDGDGKAEIWSNQVDGLASIANYLKDAGWKAGVPWGIPVRVPSILDRNSIRNTVAATECPRVHARHSRPMTMAQWRALGVTPYSQSIPDNETATLLEPDGRGQTAYLLTGNYKAILKYNCSNFYALSVGLLANAIVGR